MALGLVELFNRLRDRFHRDKLTAELDDELRFHRAMLEREHGDPRALGNTTLIREHTRDVWSLGWFDDALNDLRFAARVLRRNPGFTVAVVVTLALGIGANTAIFSVVNAVILRPLPYADPDRLYSVWNVPTGRSTERLPASYPDLKDWRTQNSVFAALGGYAFNRFELGGEPNEVVRAIIGTPELYDALGAAPLIGRLPRRDEERLPVVALSHRVWLRHYGGDERIIGRTVTMNELPFIVIGVMPPGFHFPTPDVDLWMSMFSLAGAPGQPATGPWITSRGLRGYRVVGRLKPGVSAAAAETEMTGIMHRLGKLYPDEDAATDVKLQSLAEDAVGNVRRALWLTLAAAGLVLLLACVNVAHLMLARTSARGREIAVRRALGAHRGRVVRQLLTESVLLGVVGGALGMGIAILGMRVLVHLSPGDIPRLENVALDGTTLLFGAAVSIATGMLFGVAPALVASSTSGQGLLRDGRATVGVHGARVRSALTAAEVGFALVLLIGAGLMVRSLVSLLTVNPGFRSEGVATMQLAFPDTRYTNLQQRTAALNRILEKVSAIPGVVSAGGSSSLPPARMQQGNGFTIEGDPEPLPNQEPTAIFVPATAHFLPAIGVPLIRGRWFTGGDDAAAPRVALISKELARRHFAGRDPIGRRLRVVDSMWTVVGVVGDVSYEGYGKPANAVLYVPFAQSPFGGAWVAVRSTADPKTLIGPIREAVRAVDPLLNPRELRPMSDVVDAAIVRPRFQTWLFGTFGGLALLLAAVGIYGVIGYAVAQRTSEIGLRLALGAPQASVVRMVMRRGLAPVVVGLTVGVLAALGLSRVMAGLLYDIAPNDAVTFAAVTGLLGLVAVAAAAAPAWRASRVDPLRALRSD